jgi:hypothetical protein
VLFPTGCTGHGLNPCLNIHFFADLPHQTRPARCVRVAIALSHSVFGGRNDLVCSLHSSLVLTMCYRAFKCDLCQLIKILTLHFAYLSAVTRFECHKTFSELPTNSISITGTRSNPRPR